MQPATIPGVDLNSDEPLEPVAKIAEEVTGTRPHPTTTVRWCAGRGAGGIKLPSILAGRQRKTQKSVFIAWLQAVNAARDAVA